MKISMLHKRHEQDGGDSLEFSGACRECGRAVSVKSEKSPGRLKITGGAVYETSAGMFFKCPDCFEREKQLKNHRECEVYSRIVGYLRPVSQWNSGKLSEFTKRKSLKV